MDDGRWDPSVLNKMARKGKPGIAQHCSLLMVLGLLVLSGCFGGNPTRPIEPPTDKKESEKLREVHVGAGEYTRKVSPEGPEKMWTVKWQSADLQYENGSAYGTMETVSGNIFDGEKLVGDYAAITPAVSMTRLTNPSCC